MSKVAVMVEDADLVEAFLRLLPPFWMRTKDTPQPFIAIDAHLLITLTYDTVSRTATVRMLNARDRDGLSAPVFPASKQLYDDLDGTIS
jgi:hypothetical protein